MGFLADHWFAVPVLLVSVLYIAWNHFGLAVLVRSILLWAHSRAGGSSDGSSVRVQVRNCSDKRVFVCVLHAHAALPWRDAQLSLASRVYALLPQQTTTLVAAHFVDASTGASLPSLLAELVVGWALEKAAFADPHQRPHRFQWRAVAVGITSRTLLSFELHHPVVSRHPGTVELYSTLESSLFTPLRESVTGPALEVIKQGMRDPHLGKKAKTWSVAQQVSPPEVKWRQIREGHVREALAALFGEKGGPMVNIAILSSGGGVRAMVGMLGALDGLAEFGILQCAMYLAAVSGSCWGLSAFTRALQLREDAPIQKVISRARKSVRAALALPMFPPLTECKRLLFETAARKICYKQSMTLVDAYGAVLGVRFPCSPTLSSVAPALRLGTVPLPIFTAGTVNTNEARVETAEFTPLSCTLGTRAIPTYALGRPFDEGRSTDNQVPEVPMSELLGIFGSAFCTTVEKIAENVYWVGAAGAGMLAQYIAASTVAWEKARKQINQIAVENRDVAISIPMVYPTHYSSWLFQSRSEEHTPATAPFFDAGVDCNMAWSVCLRNRAVDFVLALDHSDDTYGPHGFLTLQSLNRLADSGVTTSHGLRYPKIDISVACKRKIMVAGDPAQGEIVVVYIPTKPFLETDFNIEASCAGGFCNTANFVYETGQFDELYGLNKSNMGHHRVSIINEIAKVREYKKANPEPKNNGDADNGEKAKKKKKKK